MQIRVFICDKWVLCLHIAGVYVCLQETTCIRAYACTNMCVCACASGMFYTHVPMYGRMCSRLNTYVHLCADVCTWYVYVYVLSVYKGHR